MRGDHALPSHTSCCCWRRRAAMLSSQFSGPSSITAIVVVVAALTSAVAIPGLDDAGSKALVLWSLALVSIAVLWLTVLVDPVVFMLSLFFT